MRDRSRLFAQPFSVGTVCTFFLSAMFVSLYVVGPRLESPPPVRPKIPSEGLVWTKLGRSLSWLDSGVGPAIWHCAVCGKGSDSQGLIVGVQLDAFRRVRQGFPTHRSPHD